MKKNRLFFMFAALLVSAAVMFSCQKEEAANLDQSPILKSVTIPSGLSFSVVEGCKDQAFTVRFNIDQDVTCGTVLIEMKDPDDSEWSEFFSGAPVGGIVSPTYTPTEIGTFRFRAKYTRANLGGGNFCGVSTNWLPSATGELIEVVECCTPGFTYVDNEDGTYTFTYTPEASMTGAKLVFTFAQGVVVSGLGDWTTAGVTYQNTMDLTKDACISWTVGLDADCGGVGQSNANLWTDFTVNGDSKKGSLANIVKACN